MYEKPFKHTRLTFILIWGVTSRANLTDKSITSSEAIFFIATQITEKILKKFRCLRIFAPESIEYLKRSPKKKKTVANECKWAFSHAYLQGVWQSLHNGSPVTVQPWVYSFSFWQWPIGRWTLFHSAFGGNTWLISFKGVVRLLLFPFNNPCHKESFHCFPYYIYNTRKYWLNQTSQWDWGLSVIPRYHG